jgi:hypothetical protein
MTDLIVLAVWLILLALASPWVRRSRHPGVPPLAAFLLFATLFSVAAGTLYFALLWFVQAMGWSARLGSPPWALAFLSLVFAPAFLLARWIIRRPPLERPPPK